MYYTKTLNAVSAPTAALRTKKVITLIVVPTLVLSFVYTESETWDFAIKITLEEQCNVYAQLLVYGVY